MGREYVKQPNGLYAIFSSVVDDFIMYDATEQDLLDFAIEEATEQARKSVAGGLKACHEDTARYSTKPRPGDGLNRWREALDTIQMVHGKKRRREREAGIAPLANADDMPYTE